MDAQNPADNRKYFQNPQLILWVWLKMRMVRWSCWQQEIFLMDDKKYFQKPETNLISYQIWWGRWGPDPDLIRISRPPLSLWCITWCNMIHNAMSSVWLLFSSPLPQMSPFWGDLLPLSPYCTKNGQTRTSGDGDTLCSMDRAILVMVILMVMNWTNLIPN